MNGQFWEREKGPPQAIAKSQQCPYLAGLCRIRDFLLTVPQPMQWRHSTNGQRLIAGRFQLRIAFAIWIPGLSALRADALTDATVTAADDLNLMALRARFAGSRKYRAQTANRLHSWQRPAGRRLSPS